MSLTLNSSPHLHRNTGVGRIMALVLLACVPAWLIYTWFFGWGLSINVVITACTALSLEAALMRLRGRASLQALSDNSALVTAVLLSFAIPPGAPWWIPVLGASFAIILGKHIFGGLGHNLFNPAMVGYVALLATFPLKMTGWQIPSAQTINNLPINPLDLQGLLISLSNTFPFLPITRPGGLDIAIDGFAKATPLLFYKMAAHSAVLGEWQAGNPLFERNAETGWELINFSFLCGGLFLLWKRIISWHIPVSIILTVVALASGFYFLKPGSENVYGSPLLHLFGTATMIGAFFIATDPVSAPGSAKAKLCYGILIGLLIYSIRIWGSYLDSIGFAVLLANSAAPLLDYSFRPRIYGEPSWFARLRAALFGKANGRKVSP